MRINLADQAQVKATEKPQRDHGSTTAVSERTSCIRRPEQPRGNSRRERGLPTTAHVQGRLCSKGKPSIYRERRLCQ